MRSGKKAGFCIVDSNWIGAAIVNTRWMFVYYLDVQIFLLQIPFPC